MPAMEEDVESEDMGVSSSGEEESEEEEEVEETKKQARSRKRRENHRVMGTESEGGGAEEGGEEEQRQKEKDKEKEKKRKRKRDKSLQEGRAAVPGKRGVCYLSRIPPHLKPLKLRHLLSQYSEVLRIYLAPEDAAARLRRKRSGGNSGKNFTEGWVEFAHKSDAKKIAAMLNGESMDSSKRSAYHYDLWNIKYLHKFKWDNLTEEIAYKNAVREQRLAAEISAAKKERDFYLSKVDQSRAINSMEERKKKKKELEGHQPEKPSIAVDDVQKTSRPKPVRNFSQRRPFADGVTDRSATISHDVLAGVFGKK